VLRRSQLGEVPDGPRDDGVRALRKFFEALNVPSRAFDTSTATDFFSAMTRVTGT
jgi:hypothetical protein